MPVSRQSKGAATVGETSTSQGFRQAELLRSTGPSLTSGVASPPQTVCILSSTKEFENPRAGALLGPTSSADAGRPDKGLVSVLREDIPIRQEDFWQENQEDKPPNTLGRPWPPEKVLPKSSWPFECTGFRDPVPAWGEADKPSLKTREPDSATPLVNELQPGGLNTCIEVGSLGNKVRREENRRLPSDFRVGEGNAVSAPMNRSNGSEFILAAKSSQNLAIRWIKCDGWN
jgi:hypothetical protein